MSSIPFQKKHNQILTSLLILGLGPLFYLVLKTTHTSYKEEGKLLVVATTGMIGDAVERIGGEKVTVKTLMGAGVDPHGYELTLEDGNLLMQGDIVFYNGLHLEGSMHSPFEKMKNRKDKVVYAASDPLSEDDILKDPQFDTGKDPHIFHSVRIWMQCVEYIGQQLALADPENASLYEENTKAYLMELQALHEYVIEATKKIPKNKRYLITAHDAFGYYAREYGLSVKSLQGISTTSEPSLKDREDLKRFIISHEIDKIFTETSVNPKNIDAVIESCQEEGYPLSTSANLYSDSLGAKGGEAGTYIQMIRTNTQHITGTDPDDPTTETPIEEEDDQGEEPSP